MTIERAIKTRREEVAIMQKRLKEATTENQKREIEKRIRFVEDTIRLLERGISD